MRDARDAALEASPDGLVIVVRGERVARSGGGSLGVLGSLRVAERMLTRAIVGEFCGVNISHGNVSGVRFGSRAERGEGEAAGHIVSGALTARRGSQSVGFRQDMDWQDPAENTLLNVALVVRATAGSSQGAAIDISLQFVAGEQEEVVLGITRDSLLHLPLVGSLLPGGGGHMWNGLGDIDGRGIDGRRAPWFGCLGVVDAEIVGLSVLDHPDNPTHPPTWRIRSDGTVSVSSFETCSITLMPMESVTLRFRLLTHAGYVDEGWTAARAREFALEPLRI